MKYRLILPLLLIARAAVADDIPRHSLFLSAEQAHEAEMLAEKLQPASGDIHLGAVFYYGPKDWTLWLQGERWTPETSRDNLRILAVTAETVRLRWRDDDGAAHDISLKPNESFQIATGKIIAGR